MKQQLTTAIRASLTKLQSELENGFELPETVQIENTRDPSHGDFASNIAMVLSKQVGMPPRNLAESIINALPAMAEVSRVEIAGPGFINFFIRQAEQSSVLQKIANQAGQFGCSQEYSGQRALVEFVSANPTGPLHVGHGRGAAYGAVVSNLLAAVGYKVDREYYVNDAGRQMDILATSVYLRYLELHGATIDFPDNAYQGDYIVDIAQSLKDEHADRYCHELQELNASEAEARLDELILNVKTALGSNYSIFHQRALDTILDDIRVELKEFGVEFDDWFSERSLKNNQLIDQAIETLQNNNYLYVKDGATWFKSTELGDEKDRVVIRDNGEGTYFASDIAYHHQKFLRGYDKIIDIWGADHHGYIARVRAALQALGHDASRLEVLLVQFVSLFRGDEKMQMSTRSGQFVSLGELRAEVGRDATRFFYVMRKNEQHLDFDLELAKSNSKDNPVYYIQYAHARICRLFEKLEQDHGVYEFQQSVEYLSCLDNEAEQELLKKLAQYPEMILKSAEQFAPHNLVYYLRDLGNRFHTYYDSNRILDMADDIKLARMGLCFGVRQVIANGLDLLGVSAPESM